MEAGGVRGEVGEEAVEVGQRDKGLLTPVVDSNSVLLKEKQSELGTLKNNWSLHRFPLDTCRFAIGQIHDFD